MKAIVFDRFGAPADVLGVRDVPVPEPSPGTVRVRMMYAPINPSDMMVVRGEYGRLPSLPATPGYEGMGVVDAVGPGFLAKVRGLRPGRRVAVIHRDGGSWAEQVVVSSKLVIPLHDAVPDEQAASFFVNPATAIVMLNRVLAVPRGSWLLQTAAGSALGRMIIRLAKSQEIRTINLIRRDDGRDELERAGGDEVLVTSTDDVQKRIRDITQGAMVSYALDCVGGSMGLEAVRALAPRGRLLLYGTLSGEPIPLNPRDLMTGSKRVEGFWLSDWVQQQHPMTMLGLFRQISQSLASGVLATHAEATYTLDQIADAVRHAQRPGRTGKVLLKMR